MPNVASDQQLGPETAFGRVKEGFSHSGKRIALPMSFGFLAS